MLSSAQNIAPKPAASLPPAVQASQPANTAGSAPKFAQFLTDQASLPTPPAHTEPEPTPPEAAAPAAPAPRRATAQPAKPAAQKSASEAPAKADAKTDAKADGADKTDADKSTNAVSADGDDDDTPDTSKLKEFTQLIGMNAAAQPDAAAAAAAARPELHRGHAATASTGADDDATQGRTALQAAGDKGRAKDKPEIATAKPAELHADKAAAQAASEPLQATATKQSADLPAAAAPTQATPSFAATLAQALPPPAATPDTAPTTTYSSVQSPVNGSAFAPELGARVSLLAVDGVQQAELQLNPADMGPVAVQITVDGNQAQVSFHAAHAETRQALEQSLPDLAAALQGQGLTLSGGGVFQQAQRDVDHGEPQSGNGGTTRSARGSNSRVDGTTASAAPAARRSVGLLDTFA
ncbi:flagellar hook-length control protein FliK [Roseateles sp. BYS78W]|uniref:Flagellar hook-length control protein FliK n=1 Tax=Pelomonas candidula TaxID=3299025 RepID=A0ABW7HBU9_9BURK